MAARHGALILDSHQCPPSNPCDLVEHIVRVIVDVLRILANIDPNVFLDGGHLAFIGFRNGHLSSLDLTRLRLWANWYYDL